MLNGHGFGAAIALCGIRHARGLVPVRSAVMAAANPISEHEARAISVAAYVYFYPLVTMELTRKQLTNVAKPRVFTGR
jgi:hypothetical protein